MVYNSIDLRYLPLITYMGVYVHMAASQENSYRLGLHVCTARGKEGGVLQWQPPLFPLTTVPVAICLDKSVWWWCEDRGIEEGLVL